MSPHMEVRGFAGGPANEDEEAVARELVSVGLTAFWASFFARDIIEGLERYYVAIFFSQNYNGSSSSKRLEDYLDEYYRNLLVARASVSPRLILSTLPRFEERQDDISGHRFFELNYPLALRLVLDQEALSEFDHPLLEQLREEAIRDGLEAGHYVPTREGLERVFEAASARVFGAGLELSELKSALLMALTHGRPEDRVLGRYTSKVVADRGLASEEGLQSPQDRSDGKGQSHSAPSQRSIPPKWSDKDARKGRNALQFLLDVWGDEITAGRLTSPSLRQADPELYKDFQTFKSKNKDKVTFTLPKKQELVTAEIAERSNQDLGSMSARDYRRLRQAEYNRRRQSKGV